MKEWTEPTILDMEVSDTQYGGTETTDFDNIYQNDEGNWEGTFVAS